MGEPVDDPERPCPMCGNTRWTLLDGTSELKALEGGLLAIALSCDECGFLRWHRADIARSLT